MKKWLMTGAALLMATSMAFAGDPFGINLSWDACGTNGSGVKTFACDANSGTALMLIGSFVPPTGINEFLGITAQVDVTVGTQLPDWWKHGTGYCRGTTGLETSFDFSTDVGCLDFYLGQASGGTGYDVGYASPSRARLRIDADVPFANRGPLVAGEQYFAFKLNFLLDKTTGSGACTGCLNEACIVFNSLTLRQPAEVLNDFVMTTEEDQNWVTYQSVSILDCPSNTPTRNRTWGQVKSLYR